jgi:TRAP-type C4-dicarboxylate transport system substrate-binding protein
VVSDKHYAKLPGDVRAALEKCGAETQDFVYKHAAKLETELLDVIKAAGVAVNNADNDAFIAASKPIYDEFASTVPGGSELIKKVQSLASGS